MSKKDLVYKSTVILTKDNRNADVIYRFRNLDEAMSFKQFVDNAIRLFIDYHDEAVITNKECKEQNDTEIEDINYGK